MSASYLRVALILPPVQSLYMPYAAPAMLAALLQERFGARTLVIDAGIEWLSSELDTSQSSAADALAALRRPQTYRDAFALQEAYLNAEQALRQICAPWRPEEVKLSGEYVPPGHYAAWAEIDKSLNESTPRLFDRYFKHVLIPRLRHFRPQIVGLSVPFNWMLWPTMRFVRWLRRSCPDVTTIVGGPAIQRLWYEGQTGFFDILEANWVAVGDGERALTELVEFVCNGKVPVDGPLVKLPLTDPDFGHRPQVSAFYGSALAPDYSDLDLSRYLRPEPILPIPASEGCFYGRCRFCSRQRSDQTVTYTERTGRHVADAMLKLHGETGATQFILAGDIFTHRFLLSLAASLSRQREKLNWFCEASFKGPMASRLSQDDCDLLYQGGCRLILNGLESGSSRVRGLMDCQLREEDYSRTLSQLSRAGIVPYVTIVFGYPGETAEDLMETVRFIQKHSDESVFATSRFEIVPGTPLGEQLFLNSPASCKSRALLEGGFDYDDQNTLARSEANDILSRELAGVFGDFQQFYRQIPVLMQLLSKTWGEAPCRPGSTRDERSSSAPAL